MDPAAIGLRLASSAIGPIVKRLFVADGPGAEVGIPGKPVRLSSLVSFKGEKRTLGEKELRKLARQLVEQALRTGERPVTADEETAVADALTASLRTLGDLTLTDVEAVQLGHAELARQLRQTGGHPERHLTADAARLHDRLLDLACLHILRFFTQRSTFVATTLVAQTRQNAEAIAKLDALIARTPRPDAQDAAFEREYLEHIAVRHGRLTIYGIDLASSPGKWPLDTAYLSLQATARSRPRANPKIAPWAGGEDTADPTPLPADEALADQSRVLLRGVAGSGKTTLVQWLAVTAARQGPVGEGYDPRLAYLRGRVPFVLPLRTLTRHGERLPAPRDFLAAAGSPLAGEQPDGWERRVLREGRALVLVDGIDEVPDAERELARGWLAGLIASYPDGNRWLVTSRPTAVRERWLADEGFADLTLAAMSPADVAAFIGRWHAAAATGDEDDDSRIASYERQLLSAVRTKADLGRLATNPLLCALICALNRDRRGYLPRGRKELYSAALSMLLLRRDRERGMTGPELSEETQVQLLQRLAYWLIRNGRTQLDRDRAEQILTEALPAVPEAAALGDATAVLDHLLLRSGVLQEPAPGAVDFIHRTFQDHLGARAAVEAGDFGVLAGQAADDQWEDVIRMAVGHARPRERVEIITDLLARADRAADEAARTRIRLLAATCEEQAAELPEDVRAELSRHTAELIPPRTREEAQALGAAGPLVLDLLPGPEGLDHDAARLITIAATNVASGRAIPFLARYATHPSQAVRSQLAWGWHRFEAVPYGEQVIARLEPEELYFLVHGAEHLRELRRHGGRPRIDAREAVPPADLAAYVSDVPVTHLLLRDNELLTDLDFLAGRQDLRHVRVSRCLQLADVSGLAGVPVHSLVLSEIPDEVDLTALGGMPSLESMSYSPARGVSWSFAELPDAPLHELKLLLAPAPDDGLAGLARYEQLEALRLGVDSSPRTAADWAALGALPRLHALHVRADALDWLPGRDRLTLPGVSLLVLDGWTPSPERLRALGEAFPGLDTLYVDAGFIGHDLAPLTAAAALREIHVPADDPGPATHHRLPSRIEVVRDE